MSLHRNSILQRNELSPWAEEAPPAQEDLAGQKLPPPQWGAPNEETPLAPQKSAKKTGWYGWIDVILLLVIVVWLFAALSHDRVGIWNDKQERYVFMIIIVSSFYCTISTLRSHISYLDRGLTMVSNLANNIRLPPLIGAFLLPIIAFALFCISLCFRGISTGLIGMLLIPSTIYYFSMNRESVKWDEVLGGFGLQVLLALFGLKFPVGKELMNTLAGLVTQFLGYALSGELMVFGERIVNPTGNPGDMPFAFTVLPTIIYFAAFISICFYVGILQKFIFGISAILKKLVGASTIESVSSSGNMFLGMTEVPLLLKPLLPLANRSELHVIMVCGYASVAGSPLAGYISFGINPEYLILSCLISAPTALAMSKLACPNTEQTVSAEDDEANADRTKEALCSQDGSVAEAAGNGASNAIALVANVAAMLIAFMGIMYFLDMLSGWFFAKVGCDMTLSVVVGWVMSPLAFIMGVPTKECFVVGLLMAKKLLINEFVGYIDLGNMIKNRTRDPILLEGFGNIFTVSKRSEVIATFGMCGFANFASIGITLGGLSAVCPERRKDIAPLVVRTMFVGFAVSMFNGCIAGILIDVES